MKKTILSNNNNVKKKEKHIKTKGINMKKTLLLATMFIGFSGVNVIFADFNQTLILLKQQRDQSLRRTVQAQEQILSLGKKLIELSQTDLELDFSTSLAQLKTVVGDALGKVTANLTQTMRDAACLILILSQIKKYPPKTLGELNDVLTDLIKNELSTIEFENCFANESLKAVVVAQGLDVDELDSLSTSAVNLELP